MSDRIVVALRGLRGLPLGVALLLAVPGVARANTLIVKSAADSGTGSLRAEIAASNPAGGDTITFDQSLIGQTITLGSTLSITHALTISGPGAGNLTISGNNSVGVFDIAATSSSDVTISGLTITRGAKSGAPGGAGILVESVATLTLDADAITDNSATVNTPSSSGGGGVYVNDGALDVTNSAITDNTVTLTGADGSSNGGGGIYADGGSITIAGSDVSDNTVDQGGTTSSGLDGGGGIYANDAAVDVTSSTVNDNTESVDTSTNGSDGGGGIYANGGAVSLGDASVDDNTFTLGGSSAGNNGGGGIYEDGRAAVTVAISSVDDNTATVTDPSNLGADGGGGVFSNGGEIGVELSSISENSSDLTVGGGDDGGGAIFNEGTDGLYELSTFSGNVVTISGAGASSGGNGGGAIQTFAPSFASGLTIAGNQINAPGGGVSSTGTFEVTSTIIADNMATPVGNCVGTFSTFGFNLESANTCDLTAATDRVNANPQLGPLQNNGGPTRTQALPAGSPAVDAGSCTDIFGNALPIDQREVPRPQPAGGQCDIGAYELEQSGSGGSSPPPAQPSPSKPAATPGAAAATGASAAGFTGSVNPEGQATTVFFQYGIDSRYRPGGGTAVIYDQSTPPQTLPADSSAHAVSASATGLVPNALYHVRLVAANATGTTFGSDQTFTTPTSPAPPPPVLGQTVNAKPVSGQVFVLVGTKLVPLTQGEQLPSGSVVDARAGLLELTTAPTSGHNPETGVFGGAIFKLTQARRGPHRGLTTLSLVEGALAGAPSYALCTTHRAPDASAAAISAKTLQLLHASAHGKFATSGRYSAATVRGTKWTIADRCDGTLTHVITDSVAVSDFARHKTIVLHAGQSYLAKAPHRR